MSILSDKWIKKMSLEHQMISPFEEKQIRNGNISYGLSSFGYDARVGDEFKIFTNVNSETVDPKKFTANNFVTKKNSDFIILGLVIGLGLLSKYLFNIFFSGIDISFLFSSKAFVTIYLYFLKDSLPIKVFKEVLEIEVLIKR